MTSPRAYISPTGFVGPLTRKRINDELALGDASSTLAEISETGTTSPASTVPGCTSTTRFSPLSGQPCLVRTTAAPATLSNPALEQLTRQLALLQAQLG